MEESPKKCHSIRTKEFEKALKKSGAQIARVILKQIEQLEYYENNPEKLPDGIKSPEMTSGKMLAKLNRNIYSLEPAHSVRALAHVVQRDGVKVYVWLWGGTHEEYNNKLKIEALNKEEASSNQRHGDEIDTKLSEMSEKLSKSKVFANIQSIRENKDRGNNARYKGPKINK